jgi:hypothetical protein
MNAASFAFGTTPVQVTTAPNSAMKIIFASGRDENVRVPDSLATAMPSKPSELMRRYGMPIRDRCVSAKLACVKNVDQPWVDGDGHTRRQSIFEFVDGRVGVEFISPLRLCGAESCYLRSVL